MQSYILLTLLFIFPFLLSAQKLKSVKKTFSYSDVVEMEYTVLKKKKYVKHGEFKRYFDNGRIKEAGLYEYGKKHLSWKEYNILGEVRRLRNYQKGKLISDEKFGVWKEVGKSGKMYYFDYDKEEKIFPQLQKYIYVDYPPKAREAGITGIVKVEVKIDEQCENTEIKIVKPLRADFDKEALKGVKRFVEKLKAFENCKGY
ncbi:MAG: TonB family protein, partial [Saprospiraceae bacterium]